MKTVIRYFLPVLHCTYGTVGRVLYINKKNRPAWNGKWQFSGKI